MHAQEPVQDLDQALAPNDLGPLAWVLDEVRKSLDACGASLRRYLREAAAAAESEGEAADTASLRLARQHLHQALGALDMVGLTAAAQVLRAIESAVQAWVDRPATCDEHAVAKAEKAGSALLEFLEGLLIGKPGSPVSLFPQYREIAALGTMERVHPADLWPLEWRWCEPRLALPAEPVAYAPSVRARMDQGVLRIVKSADLGAAGELSLLTLGLAAGAVPPRARSFWSICAGFFEALSLGLLPPDLYVKRAASRVLVQYAQLARGDELVADRLAQDLVFFCAQAPVAVGVIAPLLQSVRSAWGCADAVRIDYEAIQFGRFEPALLAQVRRRIGSAKELWAQFTAGEASRQRGAADSLRQLSEALIRLHAGTSPLGGALRAVGDDLANAGEPPAPELALEVATALLYLEAAFQHFDADDVGIASRAERLAARLGKARQGGAPDPLEPWMEELYRQVSDRQTMGSVVGELRVTLAELEKELDTFFRQPQDVRPLQAAPGHLSQMRGVLSVLGLDQAAAAVLHMRDSIEALISVASSADHGGDPEGWMRTRMDRLASNLGALGFLIDMLNYQPALARKLFVYDEAKGELRPLMGRTADTTPTGAQVPDAFERTELIEPTQRVSADAIAAPAAAQAPSATEAGTAQPADAPLAGPLPELDLGFGLEAIELPAIVDGEAGWPTLDVAALPSIAPPTAQPSPVPVPTSTVVPAAPVVPVVPLLPVLPEFFADAPRLPDAAPPPAAEPARAASMTPPLPGPEAPAEIDDELRQIFIEEAREVVQTARAALQVLAAMPSDLNELTTLRRAFHTLKGSSRMVGLDTFGEAAWVFEQVFNAWLGEQKPATERLLALAGDAVQAFGLWADDIDGGRTPPWTADAFQRAVDAFHAQAVLVPIVPSWPAEVVAEPALPMAPIEAFELRLPADELPPADSTDSPPAALPAIEPAAAGVDVPELPIIDFGLVTSPEAVPSPEPTLRALVETPIADGAISPAEPAPEAPGSADAVTQEKAPALTTMLLEATSPPAPASNAPAATEVAAEPAAQDPLAAVLLPGAASDDTSVDLAEAMRQLDAARQADPRALVPDAVAAEGATPFDLDAGFEALRADDDPFKLIGDLRISLPLYNVYLNEADEWSRRLQVELSEWALEFTHRIPESTVALAHSLSGSSATIGFQALSRIARALEAALTRTHAMAWGTEQHAQAYGAAAEEIRRLLHQFAAGFLKDPNPRVMQALEALDALSPPEPAPVVVTALATRRAYEPPRAAAPHRVESLDDEREGIDVADAVDVDLFPIFEEEAAELMPQLGGALRQWHARPDNRGARDAALRTLHTIKGSARLAGALRLGEMAHRLESLIEQIGGDATSEADVEPLLQRFDAMQSAYDMLRTAGAAAAESAIDVAPEAAATPELPSAVVPTDPDTPVAPSTSRALAPPVLTSVMAQRATSTQAVRVRSQLLDRLMNQAGEVMITRSRLEEELRQLRSSLQELTGNLDRLRSQLRDIELQAETQMQSRLAQAKDSAGFDPLEFDRFTRVQELTRMMAESVNDVATVQRNLQRTVEATEDDLAAQARQTRELQRDLLRTRMVEFEAISDRLYRVVRQAAKDTGRQVRLDIEGGSIEIDRGVLDRMTPAFEHLLRNCVAHGIEDVAQRVAAGKDPVGQLRIVLSHEGNDVSVEFRDDGAGLDLARIRERALSQGLVPPGSLLDDREAMQLIFTAGFSTASQVTEVAGRGIGMDVVRAEVDALGGRIEIDTQPGQGTGFRLVLPLTTAVTQVVMIRCGALTVGVPSPLVEVVRRATLRDLQQAYNSGQFANGEESVPFFWAGALLQSSRRSDEPQARTLPVVVCRSASQRIALHVDEVLGNREVVVKNLGPQLARVAGMAGLSVLPSGAVVLIYNPVALATVHGEQARAWSADQAQPEVLEQGGAGTPHLHSPGAPIVPLVLVVDDSITVRRVTQRLLQREGWRVALAADGLQALERLAEETPAVVLSDIEMPRMDGFDLVRNLRGNARWSELPVVMITSRIAEKHREHARQLGVNHYLGKPYSEEELLGLVRRYASPAVPASLTADQDGG